MCKPTNCSAADSFEDLLFGEPVQQTKEATPKATKATPKATKSKKEKKSKGESKPKVQLNGDKVLAERFRTKRCKNFIEKGSCPYESRCMFAHGEHELRNAEQNLHDGLVSEEAIRQFKKMMTLKLRAQAAEARHRARVQESQAHHQVALDRYDGDISSPSSNSYGASETSSNSGDDCSRVYVGDSFYYNPYAWSAIEAQAVSVQ